MMQENAQLIFPDGFEDRYQRLAGKYFDPSIGLITRLYGNDLADSPGYGFPIKILQIGGGNSYEAGPRQSKTLRKLGAEVHNLDVEDLMSHYEPEDNFRQGSWFDIDEIYKEELFNVIYIRGINPDVMYASVPEGPRESEVEHQLNVLKRTLGHVGSKNYFFIEVTDATCFSFPSSVLQREITKGYSRIQSFEFQKGVARFQVFHVSN